MKRTLNKKLQKALVYLAKYFVNKHKEVHKFSFRVPPEKSIITIYFWTKLSNKETYHSEVVLNEKHCFLSDQSINYQYLKSAIRDHEYFIKCDEREV